VSWSFLSLELKFFLPMQPKNLLMPKTFKNLDCIFLQGDADSTRSQLWGATPSGIEKPVTLGARMPLHVTTPKRPHRSRAGAPAIGGVARAIGAGTLGFSPKLDARMARTNPVYNRMCC
jgi:hypothetical protein